MFADDVGHVRRTLAGGREREIQHEQIPRVRDGARTDVFAFVVHGSDIQVLGLQEHELFDFAPHAVRTLFDVADHLVVESVELGFQVLLLDAGDAEVVGFDSIAAVRRGIEPHRAGECQGKTLAEVGLGAVHLRRVVAAL